MIIAAAGPLWNPPIETATGAAPIALLIDDGWAAAASWSARMRTAEDLIARADTDNRGVAVANLIEGARRLSTSPGVDTMAAQRRIADAVIQAERFPL